MVQEILGKCMVSLNFRKINILSLSTAFFLIPVKAEMLPIGSQFLVKVITHCILISMNTKVHTLHHQGRLDQGTISMIYKGALHIDPPRYIV